MILIYVRKDGREDISCCSLVIIEEKDSKKGGLTHEGRKD